MDNLTIFENLIMNLRKKIIFKCYLKLLQSYGKYKRQNPSLIPSINLSSPKSNRLLFILTKIISSQFQRVIQKQMLFYMKNYGELEAVQEPLGVGLWLEFIVKTENLDGDILELGAYKGGMTCLTADFLQKISSVRKIYACDSFSGIPYDDKFSNVKNAEGRFGDTSEEFVQKKIQKFNLTKKVELVSGLFEDTLHQKLSDHKFSLILLDCDVYDATKFALDFAYSHLTTNGIIMLDDYERAYIEKPLWGATKAINEFVEKNNLTIHTFPDNYIIKK